METPEIVKCSTGDMLQDIPLTLEQVVLKHFRRSNDVNDKLFTDDIVSNISDKTDFQGSVDLKLLSAIILKCNVGTRTANGKITINGKKLSGYSNIKFVE
jgi:hypothetical protein